ncbi:MAG: hypothetical protein OEU92_31005 [Alphaproteobacteria bacterium]|nr:hypothetical protein [Alphaproteobacteria bacterium]
MAKKTSGPKQESCGDLAKAITSGKVVLPDGYKPKAHDGHKKSFTSNRKAAYRGRSISVRTSYRIEIDGEPLSAHVTVQDDGSVRCHSLPNYAFSSAVDMAKALIDVRARQGEVVDEIGHAMKKHPQSKKSGGSK